MEREQFVEMFAGMDCEQVENVFNTFNDETSQYYAYTDFYAGNDYDFWQWCAEHFSYDMKFFAIVCSDFKDAEADYFIFDGEYENIITGYYDEEDYIEGIISYFWKNINQTSSETEVLEKVEKIKKLIEYEK